MSTRQSGIVPGKGNAMTCKRTLQDRFLKTCRTSPKTLADVMDDLGIAHEMLDGWMDEPRFGRRVMDMRKSLSRVRALEFERGVTQAAARMTRFAIGAEVTFPERERRACLDLIKLWNADEKKRARRRKIFPKYPCGRKRLLPNPLAGDAPTILRRMEKRKGPSGQN